MRRVVALIMTLITLTMVGCSEKTIILEEDTKVKQALDNEKITERVIENKYGKSKFSPLFYNEEGVYGVLSDTRLNVDISPEKMNKPYLIDGNGEFNELDKDYFSSDELKLIQESGKFYGKYYGIYSEGTHTKDRNYYYMDIVNDIKIKLECYEEFMYEARESSGFSINGTKINENYYVDIINIGIDSNSTEASKKEKITIVDIENKISYTVENEEWTYIYFYYDDRENSIMAIDKLGKVSKIILNDNRIKFEYYKSIESNEFEFPLNTNLNNNFGIGENIILTLLSRKDSFIMFGLYNIYSNEITVIDDFVIGAVKNSNLFMSDYNNGVYLSRINESNEIEQIYKICDMTEGFDAFKAVASDDGKSIFVVKIKGDYKENATNHVDKIEYSFIDLESN
ncbi:hypothetical protein [Clostridium sp.]|uniref:hypothetical protein n=1 Tax=Clostridium sp. TaxID=1506 RepID=UPI003F34E0A4